MSYLSLIASLIELSNDKENDIVGFSFGFGFTKMLLDRRTHYFPGWKVDIYSQEGLIIEGNSADTLEVAFEQVIEDCRNIGIVVPTRVPDDLIVNHTEVKALISRIRATIVAINDYLTLSVTYLVETESPGFLWEAFIMEGSRWESITIAKAYGPSLYEVFIQLLEQLESVQKG